MASARLNIDENETAIGEEPVTFGRSADNTFPFPDNSNISRNHALIEFRDGAYHLLDLGSSNGTALNGVTIDGDAELHDGDFVTLGNSVIVRFFEDEMPEAEAEAGPEESPAAVKAKRNTLVLGATGAVCGLALVFASVAGYVAFSGDDASGCTATARIVSPRNGDVIDDRTDVRVNVTESDCVRRIILTLNGTEIASLEDDPYTTSIDPDRFADLSDGGLYPLMAVIEDRDGRRIEQALAVNLQFETREVAEPEPTEVAGISPTPTPAGDQKQASLTDTRNMAAGVVRKFTGASARYNLSNPEFLQEVRKRTAEYAVDGYFQRATQYRDRINGAFVREKTLDPALGFILAMSRSKFNAQTQGTAEGLWQMSNDFVNANAYNVVCATYGLSEPTQECASRVAAFYVKDLVDAFDGDMVYAAAAFGKTAGEANVFKATLPADRSDFWKVLSDSQMRENVARFFAAAVVAENPQRFKLKNDRPISELYPAANTN